MRCAKCSTVMPEGSRVCDSCGALVETSSLKLADRLRAANPNTSRRPTGSASNPGSLKIGARLRVLAQQSEEVDEEPNPFSFSRPKSSASTSASPMQPTPSVSSESPFAMREPTPSAVTKAPAPPVISAISEGSFTTEPEESVPVASPSGSPFAPPPSLVVSEVSVTMSPFDTPSMQDLMATTILPQEPSGAQAPVLDALAENAAPSVPEAPPELPVVAPEIKPESAEQPTPQVIPSSSGLVFPALTESKASVLPPSLPPAPSGEKKNLRDIIRERTQKGPSSDSLKAVTPAEVVAAAPAKPSGAGLFKPPPPLSPKPPPLIGSKPKAGPIAPPAPKPPGLPPLLAKTEPPKKEPTPAPIAPPQITITPEPPQKPTASISEPSEAKPLQTMAPSSSVSESIEIDDLMAEIEEEMPAKAVPPPPLDELEAISDGMDSFDKLDGIHEGQAPAFFSPKERAALAPEPSTPEEQDEFAAALQSLDVSSAGAAQNPFEKPHEAPKSQISENTRLALSLDTAAGSVDDLFGNLVQASAPVVKAVSAPPFVAPQSAQSSIELDDSDMEPSRSNPFEESEADVVIDAQAGEAVNSLAEKAATYRKLEKWRELVEVLKQIAARSREPFQLWVEIGDLQWDKLQDKTQSIDSHQKAMAQDAKNEKFVERLLSHCFEASRWEEGFELLERLGVLAPTPAARARRFFEAALLLHQKYQQSEIALDLFNEALDIDAQLLESFEQIDRILTKQRNWGLLEQNYLRMVRRVPETQRPLLVMLWHNLGEIYRTRLGQMRQASDAFEEASRLDPTNPTRQKILAELYANDPSQWERTAEHERLLFATGADRERSLHSLFRVYSGANQRDRAFRVSAILVSMGVATQEEEAFYSHGLGVMPRMPALPISENLFQRLISPKSEDSSLSTIFRLLSPYAAVLYSRSEKEWGLNKKERVELSSTKYPFVKSLQTVLRQLQLPTPVLYVNTTPSPDEPPNTGLEVEPLLLDKHFAPALIAGTSATSPRRESDTIFLLARHLAYLRPEYLLIRLCRVHQGLLKILLRAAIHLVNNSIPLPKEEEEEILQLAKRLSKEVPAPIVSQIKLTVEEAIRHGNDFSTTRWMAQVEHSVTRAAFVLCGDIEAASRILQSDTTPLSVLATRAKLQELHLYMLSEEYSVLRDELKIAWPAGRT